MEGSPWHIEGGSGFVGSCLVEGLRRKEQGRETNLWGRGWA